MNLFITEFKKKRSLLLLLIVSILLSSCRDEEGHTEGQEKEGIVAVYPLPSWNEGVAREAIIDFVDEVCDKNSPAYIRPEDRIACFDNDGTLWSEKPFYFQLFFAIDRVKALAPDHPEWKDQQPYKSILEDDYETFASYGEHGILEIVMATHAGMTNEQFERIVSDWLKTAKHPRFDRPFTELVYQPMLELLAYLKANEFKCFIVSGGGIDFMRAWVEVVYGIPKDQVVGSTIKTELIYRDSIPEIMRLGQLEFIDDKEEKAIAINRFIGRRPILTVGNSDGDLAMLKWTAAGDGKRMMVYVHHTDSVREWAYDRNSSVGRLNTGLDEARRKNWTVVSMKEDWGLIYPFELKEETN